MEISDSVLAAEEVSRRWVWSLAAEHPYSSSVTKLVEVEDRAMTVRKPRIVSKVRAREDQLVYFASFVDPPVLCSDGDITMPHAWASSAVDRAKEGTVLCDEGEVVDVVWDEKGGLAVLCSIPLRKVLRSHGDCGEDWFRLKVGALCAGIEYYPVWQRNGVQANKEVFLRSLQTLPPGGGCNPGTCLVYPGASAFSVFARRAHFDDLTDPERERFKVAPKLSLSRASALFGRRKSLLEANRILEEVAKACSTPGGDLSRLTVGKRRRRTSQEPSVRRETLDLWQEESEE